MRYKTTFIIGIALATVFFFYMITYQIGFNETVVVTTFGKADDRAVYDGSGGDAGFIGNLRFKWPEPVQTVRRYDRRVHILEDRLEEQQTRDRQSVIAQAYVAWRISEPLDFFRSLQTVPEAERRIQAALRDARSEIGNYSFDDLTNADPQRLKLAELEEAIRRKLLDGLERQATGGQSWGIEIESVGIKRLILPESVSSSVFDRMRATRERLAQAATSEGEGRAVRIRSTADNNRRTILAFAERRAQNIRSEGDAAAARYFEAFQEAPELAIFLRKMETYREVLKQHSTFFFDARQGLFEYFHTPPVGAPTPPVADDASPELIPPRAGAAANPAPEGAEDEAEPTEEEAEARRRAADAGR